MSDNDEQFLVPPFQELQQEKDILQERMSEQLMKISSLQTRLDEQRIRAEELNKQSNSDLTLRVHDLQNELSSLRETLTSRDKQIANLNQLLEHSKKIIERQDHELAFSGDNDKSLYEKFNDELKRKNEEIDRLKERIKSEMISKAVIPDLMETMIAEKNEEIDSLKEQLTQQSRNVMKSTPPSSIGGGTVLSMISECDEPDVLRKMIEPEAQIALTSFQNMVSFLPDKFKKFFIHLFIFRDDGQKISHD
jgi:chromosome segregation ATPase